MQDKEQCQSGKTLWSWWWINTIWKKAEFSWSFDGRTHGYGPRLWRSATSVDLQTRHTPRPLRASSFERKHEHAIHFASLVHSFHLRLRVSGPLDQWNRINRRNRSSHVYSGESIRRGKWGVASKQHDVLSQLELCNLLFIHVTDPREVTYFCKANHWSRPWHTVLGCSLWNREDLVSMGIHWTLPIPVVHLPSNLLGQTPSV